MDAASSKQPALVPGCMLLAGHLAACMAGASYAGRLLVADPSHFVLLLGIQALILIAAVGGVLTFVLAALARRPVRADDPRSTGAGSADHAAGAAKS